MCNADLFADVCKKELKPTTCTSLASKNEYVLIATRRAALALRL